MDTHRSHLARPCPAVVSLLTAAALVAGCETSPTGRTQLQLFPADQVAQMGESAYAQVRQREPVARGTPASRYIECVARAVTVVPPPQGGGRWDVRVFQGDQVNAFALPGGNIGI